jgi:hypothetical protein
VISVRLLLSVITNEGGWNSLINSSGWFSSAGEKCLFPTHQVLEISVLQLMGNVRAAN